MPNCRHTAESITELREGGLSFWQAWRLRFHLRMCPQCSEFAKQIDHTRDAVADLPRESPPDRVRDHVLDKFRNRDDK